MAAAGLFFVILGAGQWINGHDRGKYLPAWAGVVAVHAVPVVLRDAVRESEGGLYGHKLTCRIAGA